MSGASSHLGYDGFQLLLFRITQSFTRPGVLPITLVCFLYEIGLCIRQKRISSRATSDPDVLAVLWFLSLWNKVQIVMSLRLSGGRWAKHMVLGNPWYKGACSSSSSLDVPLPPCWTYLFLLIEMVLFLLVGCSSSWLNIHLLLGCMFLFFLVRCSSSSWLGVPLPSGWTFLFFLVGCSFSFWLDVSLPPGWTFFFLFLLVRCSSSSLLDVPLLPGWMFFLLVHLLGLLWSNLPSVPTTWQITCWMWSQQCCILFSHQIPQYSGILTPCAPPPGSFLSQTLLFLCKL